MAHFAQLDENDIVVQVIVVPNNQQHRGQEFCADDLGLGGTWVQTSYNGNIRKNYAGAGMKFDRTRDAFIAPQPYPSWVLNEDTCVWEAPIARPESTEFYYWNEELQNWTTEIEGTL
jgi:hypothetical protein